VALVVSGGHTSLFYLKDFSHIRVLGQTQDDACGEAFDKVARIMGLGYPGGPLIEKLSRDGDKHKIKFACSGTKGELDFSFSGIKNRCFVLFKRYPAENQIKKCPPGRFFSGERDKCFDKKILAGL